MTVGELKSLLEEYPEDLRIVADGCLDVDSLEVWHLSLDVDDVKYPNGEDIVKMILY